MMTYDGKPCQKLPNSKKLPQKSWNNQFLIEQSINLMEQNNFFGSSKISLGVYLNKKLEKLIDRKKTKEIFNYVHRIVSRYFAFSS